MDYIRQGDFINVDGMAGFVTDVHIDDTGQVLGFVLKAGSSLHHFNIDMMMEDLEPVLEH